MFYQHLTPRTVSVHSPIFLIFLRKVHKPMETSGIKLKRQFTFNKNFPSRSKHWAQIFGSITVQALSTVDYCLYTLCRDAAAVCRTTVTEYRKDTHRCYQRPICFCYPSCYCFPAAAYCSRIWKLYKHYWTLCTWFCIQIAQKRSCARISGFWQWRHAAAWSTHRARSSLLYGSGNRSTLWTSPCYVGAIKWKL